MIDWDYYKVGIFDFVRDDSDRVMGFRWQWDMDEEPTLFTKCDVGMLGAIGRVDLSRDDIGGDEEEGRIQAEGAQLGISGEGEMTRVQPEARQGGSGGIREHIARLFFTSWGWRR